MTGLDGMCLTDSEHFALKSLGHFSAKGDQSSQRYPVSGEE